MDSLAILQQLADGKKQEDQPLAELGQLSISPGMGSNDLGIDEHPMTSDGPEDATVDVETAAEGKSVQSNSIEVAVAANEIASSASCEYCAETPEREVIFEIFCLLTDMRSVQGYVHQLWIDFMQGKVNLITAAMTINTAMDVIGQVEARFLVSHPRFSGSLRYLDQMYDEICGVEGQGQVSIDVTEVGHFTLSLPMQALKGFKTSGAEKKAPGNFHLTTRGDARAAWAEMDSLRTAMDELQFLRVPYPSDVPDSDPVPAADTFSYGITALVADAFSDSFVDPPLKMVFAARLYLDIYKILGDGRNRGLRELQKVGRRIHAMIKTYQQVAGKIFDKSHITSLHPDAEKGLQYIEVWVLNDGLATMKTTNQYDSLAKPFEAFSNHPWLCGVIAFRLEQLLHNLGFFTAMSTDYVTPWAHIYNAAFQEGQLPTPWTDMEKVITMHSQKQFFRGAKPKSPKAYGACWALAQGFSVTSFAKHSKRKVAIRKTNLLVLEDSAPMSRIFLQAIGPQQGQYETRTPILEKALNWKGHNKAKPQHTGSGVLRHRWAETGVLTPTDVLEFIKACFMEERDALLFDYIGLLRRCYTIGRQLYEDVSQICKASDYPYIDSLDTDVPAKGITFTAFVVLQAFKKFRTGDMMDGDALITTTAINALRKVIESEGDMECRRLDVMANIEARIAQETHRTVPTPTSSGDQQATTATSGEEQRTESTSTAQENKTIQQRMARGLASLY
ncbi:MAG: hypothetical protein Q9218_007163 [Villophora microphyllina]